MNFTVTEEEAAVLAAVAGVAAGADPWGGLASGGWLDLVADDDPGGLAYTGLVAEELGAAGVSVPLIGTAVVWPTLFRSGTAGRRVAVAAGAEGKHLLAEDGADAELVVVVDDDGAAAAYDTFSASPVGGLAGDGLAAVELAAVELATDPVEHCTDPHLVAEALLRAAAVATSEMAGALRRVAAMTAAHVTEREQFGRPIGSFQAVAHGAAELATLAEAATWAARLACRSPAPEDTHAAKGWISQASQQAAAIAHQLHGAVGFTEEYGLGRLTKRLRTLRFAWGDDRTHHLALGGLIRTSSCFGGGFGC